MNAPVYAFIQKRGGPQHAHTLDDSYYYAIKLMPDVWWNRASEKVGICGIVVWMATYEYKPVENILRSTTWFDLAYHDVTEYETWDELVNVHMGALL